jgi:folate-binding protein YgfZ
MSLTVFHHLTSRALVGVRGTDWRPFLQNLLSNDVEALPVGQARAALLLTPQGKLLFDLIVTAGDDWAIIDVQKAQRDDLVRRLTLYRLRAKLQFALLDDHVWAAVGERPGEDWFADPRLPALGWRHYGDGPSRDIVVGDESGYRAHALALGVPDPALDCTPDKTFPLEADFDLLNAIDFHKGCYVGQETTSRMKRRSAVKTRMVPIVFEGPPPPQGAPVMAGGDLRAGEVLSGDEGRAMALLRLDRAMGGDLSVNGRVVRLEIPGWWPQGVLPAAGEDGSD